MPRTSKISKFKILYSNLPPSERKLPIIKIGGKFFTWEEVYEEIRRSTKLKDKILKELEKMGVI
ncbi:MAG: hypothetical protein DRP00_06070 [Candidatus Aenigmatarchaeota archaeon]|nr:MAG: hypothetical protein DRP00_06070 [Candidatus Aenigmarchaeota archaeon]